MTQEPGYEFRVRCPPCGTFLVTDDDDIRYPHGFRCPGCGGCVDVQVTFDTLGEHNCGGITINGVRCEVRIPANRTVCDNCTYVAALEWVKNPHGRKVLAALLADDEIEAGRMEAKRRRDAEAEIRRRAAAEDGNQPGHVVYYARLGNNHIKIGTTVDLPRRMVELRVVNVSNLLAAEPGGYDVERQRHEQFRKWRYNRRKEDFGEGPDLLEHIRAIREQHGPPYELAAQLANKIAPH